MCNGKEKFEYDLGLVFGVLRGSPRPNSERDRRGRAGAANSTPCNGIGELRDFGSDGRG